MTRETKERAKQMWDEWKWWIALVVLPFSIWAFRTFDASKVGVHEFNAYVNQQYAKEELRTVRDSARYAELRREIRYGNCLQENRGSVRACGHLRTQ